MLKGLEAFNYIFDTIPMPDVDKKTKQKIYCAMDDIEKGLKTLDIIIKKNVDVEGFKEALKSAIFLQLETYNNWVRYDKERMLVEEEFNTLKEALGK